MAGAPVGTGRPGDDPELSDPGHVSTGEGLSGLGGGFDEAFPAGDEGVQLFAGAAVLGDQVGVRPVGGERLLELLQLRLARLDVGLEALQLRRARTGGARRLLGASASATGGGVRRGSLLAIR